MPQPVYHTGIHLRPRSCMTATHFFFCFSSLNLIQFSLPLAIIHYYLLLLFIFFVSFWGMISRKPHQKSLSFFVFSFIYLFLLLISVVPDILWETRERVEN